MVFMTKPCQDTGEQPDGSPWPEDSPRRQAVYNSLLDQVARENPGTVYIQNLNSYVVPGGDSPKTSTACQCGRRTACTSSSPSPVPGGDYLAPTILPYWEKLGHVQEAGTGGRSIERNPPPPFLAPA